MNIHSPTLRSFLVGGLLTLLGSSVNFGAEILPLETFNVWPPPDWEIIDGGDTSDTWVQDAGTQTVWGSEPVAKVDSDAAGSGSALDEELITPTLDCSTAAIVILEFDQYFRFLSDFADVDVSTDNGQTWETVLSQPATVGSVEVPDHQELDISAFAAGSDQVKVRFHYYDDGVWSWYWLVDNVRVYEPDDFCVEVSPMQSIGVGVEDSTVDHVLEITNCGTESGVVSLEIVESNWQTLIMDMENNPVTQIDMSPQEMVQILVRVDVPVSMGFDTAVFRAHLPSRMQEALAEVTTTAALYFEDFSNDPTGEWSGFGPDGWEWGPATASSGCSGNQDPDMDHSPTMDNNILGYSIGGCYQNNLPATYITSPAFDFTGIKFATFGFYRFLGVESSSYDHASVELSTDNESWEILWEHTTGSFSDADWTLAEYDISPFINGDSNVWVRFGMGESDSSVSFCGWNLDDLYLIRIPSGYVSGVVSNDMGPIEGAMISVGETGAMMMTDPTGFYELELPAGISHLTCEAPGHNPAMAEIEVLQGEMITQDFVLTYPEIDVAPMEIEVTVDMNSTQNETLTITNAGNGPLEYRIQITHPEPERDLWDLWFDYNVEALTGDNMLLGAEFLNGSLWVTGPASDSSQPPNYLYEISADGGTLLNVYDQAASAEGWGYRDLASDGMYLYAGCGSNFYQIDPSDGSIVAEVTHSLGIVIRALAYIPETGTFVTGDFESACIEFAFDGNSVTEVRRFDLGLEHKYGMAYDDTSAGGPYLWIFDQSGTPATSILQADIAEVGNEMLTGVAHTLPLLSGITDQTAGGLFITTEWEHSKIILGGLVQGTDIDKVFGVELGDWSTWIYLNRHSGTVPAPPDVNLHELTVTFDSNGVEEPGDYHANIVISNNDGDENPVVVPATMHVESQCLFRLQPEYQEGVAEAGFTADYVFTVQNLGEQDDTYDIAVVSSTWAMEFPDGNQFFVASGDEVTFGVTIQVDSGAVPGDVDTGVFSVTSQCNGEMREGTVLTTTSVSVGYIGGFVTSDDGGNPVENAVVCVVEMPGICSQPSGPDGSYFTDNVPLGTYTVRCDSNGYQTAQVSDVEVLFHETTTVDFDLFYGEIDVNPDSFEAVSYTHLRAHET